jgi:hypothetical protein
MKYSITGSDAKRDRPTGIYLQDSANRHPRRNACDAVRHGVLDNSKYDAITIDKNQVKGDVGVLHPEAYLLFALQEEQHAAVQGKFVPIHQSSLPLKHGAGNFH